MKQYLITGATLPDGNNSDIAVKDGSFVGLGANAAEALDQGYETVDASGLQALPGLVDIHTHLRQPGSEDAETVETGTLSAAYGGYTCVHAMANTNPVQDNAGIVEQVQHLGKLAGWVEVRPVGAVSAGLEGKHLADLGSMNRSDAHVTVFSDDGKCVSDPVLMRRALEYVKTFDGVVAQHAQDPRLTEGSQMNESPLSAEIGLTGWPDVAEEAIILRDIQLASHVGSRVHICHLSTAGSVDIVRWAKSRGIKVTAEATPHHISLTEELARTYDPRYKVNPPLRTSEDVEAVIEGLVDGTIDCIGTDHAPHPLEAKDCEWQAGAFGMIGLETALPIIQKVLVDSGKLNWADVARIMSTTPAQIGRVADQGQGIVLGAPAHLTLLDPSVKRTIALDSQHSKSTNTPYLGMELPGQVKYTMLSGAFTIFDLVAVPLAERK
ncbi:MAG: dihydroorotase [Mobiluncus sp.]|uniref:dihydroorotase n=1 Tax=Mobiluncus sp. TaxID=47293 RepID=UPI0025879FA0|nr:dihydroorotase [Mobiluncus sp.]MCI6585393.1 dihydroorotase [Mobiluncus sp.]